MKKCYVILCSLQNASAGTGFQIPHFLSYVFRIPKPRIPDPISKNFPDSGLYKQKFARFRIVQAKISSIPDCTSKNFPRFRIITNKNFPDSGLYKQKFPGLRNPNSLSWGKWRVDLLFQKFEKWIYSKSTPAVAQLSHKKWHLYSWHFKRKWRDKVTDSCTHN